MHSASNHIRTRFWLLCSVLWIGCMVVGFPLRALAQSTALAYPPALRVQQVDTYHGVPVADPYRWLEDLESEQTRAWIKAQDDLTSRFFHAIPERDRIERKLRALAAVTMYRRPIKAGGRYFYVKTPPDEVGALYVQENPEAEPRLLVDPQASHPDGSVSLGATAPSRDGKKLTYSINGGLMWDEVRILDVDRGTHYPETLVGMTWRSSVAWTPDHRGFYYMRFDAPEPGSEMTANPVNGRIMYHRLGTSQAEDRLIYRRPDQPTWMLSPVRVTDDGHYLVFSASGESAAGNGLFYKDLTDPDSDVIPLIPNGEEAHTFVGNDGAVFWISSTLEAPRGRLVAVDLKRPEPAYWRTLIPENKNAPLIRATVVGEQFICWYTEDVKPRLKVYDFKGKHVDDIALPSITGYLSAASITGTRDDPELFYDFRNSAYPSSLFLYDTRTGANTVFRASENLPWSPEDIVIEQVFYPSKDGTRIPMFLVYKKDTSFDGRNPTYMPGYGAGGWIMNAGFSSLALLLVESGGLVAIPGLRGGGEYGITWHEDGARLNKQNTFDDYIAAAEWLIKHQYTAPDRLIAQGLSAGGTVPAAAVGQRPDLFGLSLPTWPVIEMIRFPQFTGGKYWVGEYGSPEDPGAFEVLLSYSPYHTVTPGTCYPPTLVVAGEKDQAAMPMHAYKYVAALQHAQSCDNPILLDVVWGGGHLPTSSQAPSHFADYLAFAVKVFGLDLSGLLDEH